MRPSLALELHRQAIRDLVAAHDILNPRVFGSVLRGTDTEASDLDVLVDAPPGTGLIKMSKLRCALVDQLGVRVDLRTAEDLSPRFRDAVVNGAQPV